MIAMRTGTTARQLNILVVDDHEMVRRGVRALIEDVPGWKVCAEAEDGLAALAAAREFRPDLVVMDISMPKLSGIDVILHLKKLLPSVEILALTMHESDRIMAPTLRAGARGYLLKRESGEKLLEAIAALSRHESYFSSAVSDTLLRSYLQSDVIPEREQLTPRERQIVKLVAEGCSNKGIAHTLKVSIKTVETHRAAAMRKVGVSSSAGLTLYAARNELVQL
jgi:DNA-binding NarL/FixJ family response regulator